MCVCVRVCACVCVCVRVCARGCGEIEKSHYDSRSIAQHRYKVSFGTNEVRSILSNNELDLLKKKEI